MTHYPCPISELSRNFVNYMSLPGFSTEMFHHLYRSFYAKHKYYTHIDSLIQTYTESYRPQFNSISSICEQMVLLYLNPFSPAVCKSVQDYLLVVAFRNDRRSHVFWT